MHKIKNLKQNLYTFIVLTITLASFSCAQLKDEITEKPGQPTEQNLYIMSGSLQLPVPDLSYSARTLSAVGTTDSNVRNLVALIDSFASPLKEMNMHLTQTIAEGQRPQGDLYNITLKVPEFASSLKGNTDDAKGVINWIYELNGKKYFSGTQSKIATRGDLAFTQNGNPLDVHWEYGTGDRVVTLRQSSSNFLEFKYVQSPKNNAIGVELSGHISGGLEIKGFWDQTGGWYNEGTTKYCWNENLSNLTCPEPKKP